MRCPKSTSGRKRDGAVVADTETHDGHSHALAVKKLLGSRYIPEIVKIEHQDGSPVEAPRPVPWYPDELAWSMTTPKNVVRKFAPFAAFQRFLVSETCIGNISRQEVVSMIPPLLIRLRPGMTVLDMCAAPGSKSAQLLEMIHQGEEERVRRALRRFADADAGAGSTPDDDGRLEPVSESQLESAEDDSDCGRATGLLIANDSDYRRGHMLVHQLKRLSSPNLLVTNHDATQFPSLRLPSIDPSTGKAAHLRFDRILADVPCSGDGTIRKNVNLWKDWQPGNALGLHTTQVRILVRALQLLKLGGRVVYSTCSLNPVENEAVVASALERCGGSAAIEIVDCSQELVQLKRKPGMKSWSVIDKAGRVWDSWSQVQEVIEATAGEGGGPAGRLVPTMFPRTEGGEAVPLERCMRVYPHLQDTGGFFIAVLEKKADFRAKNENEPKRALASTAAEPEEPKPEESKQEPGWEGEAASKATGSDEELGTNGGKRRLEEAEESAVRAEKKTKLTEPASSPSQREQHLAAEDDQGKEDQAAQTNKPSASKRHGPPEEPFKYLDPGHPVIENIKRFYDLSARFPDDRYMVRNAMGEPAKAIYYTSALTRDILTENEGRGVRFVHGGVRMFMKQEVPAAEVCRWRIQSEGMPILQGYVGASRVVRLHKKETLRKLLIEMFPRIADGGWRDFDEIGERVRDVSMGCCVLRVEPEGGEDADFSERMAMPLWKSVHSLNLMLPKEERSAMLLRIFNDTSPLINTSLRKQQTANGQGTPAAKEEQEEDKTEAREPLQEDGVELGAEAKLQE